MSQTIEAELAEALRGCLSTLNAIALSPCSNKAHTAMAEGLDWEGEGRDVPRYQATLAKYDASIRPSPARG